MQTLELNEAQKAPFSLIEHISSPHAAVTFG